MNPPIFCPICGHEMDMSKSCLMCPISERSLPKKTTEWIMRALKNSNQVKIAEVDEDNTDYLCPNCRSKLIEYTKFDRYYKCENCGLELKAMSHFQFEEFEYLHKSDWDD